MSQPDCEISNTLLALIQETAKTKGYLSAIRYCIPLPYFKSEYILERVHWHYVSGPASFYDAFLLERAWLKAIEEAIVQAGTPIHFRFAIDLQISSGPDLPKIPDNPS